MPADLPAAFTRPDLEEAGFAGWHTWDELRDGAISEIPGKPGVYLVYRESARRPSLPRPSPAP